MKTITIRLHDVEAALLVEGQRRNRVFKNLEFLIPRQIR